MSRIPRNHKGEALFGGELATGSLLIPTAFWENEQRTLKNENPKTAPSVATMANLFGFYCLCTRHRSWKRLGGQWATLVAESNNQVARGLRYDTQEARDKAAKTVHGQIAHTRISNGNRALERIGLLPLQKRGGGRDKLPSIRQVLFPAPEQLAPFLTERELSRYVDFLGGELSGAETELSGAETQLSGKRGQLSGPYPATPRITSTDTTRHRERNNENNFSSIADLGPTYLAQMKRRENARKEVEEGF